MLLAVVLYLVGRPDDSPPSTKPTSIPQPTGAPVHVPKVPRTEIADRWCPKMLAALPLKVGGLERRKVSGGNEYAAAWGNPAVIVHCGVARPKTLTKTSPTVIVNTVQWLVPQGNNPNPVWTAVDRSVYIDITIPATYSGDAMLTDVGKAITKTLAKRPIKFR